MSQQVQVKKKASNSSYVLPSCALTQPGPSVKSHLYINLRRRDKMVEEDQYCFVKKCQAVSCAKRHFNSSDKLIQKKLYILATKNIKHFLALFLTMFCDESILCHKLLPNGQNTAFLDALSNLRLRSGHKPIHLEALLIPSIVNCCCTMGSPLSQLLALKGP